jgi:NAD(P)-dependent dehydrogenase (short-subunit alcohol dehydrogenase family)
VSINYFGTIEMLEGLRDLLANGTEAAAIVIASNSTTTVPTIDEDLIAACLDGDEDRAREIGEKIGSLASYPTTKTAIVRWARRHAVTEEWIGSGITLNAIAPGAVETALTAESRADPVKGPLFDKFPLPAGRMGRAEELAGLVAYLLGPEARFFVGSLIFCDGGTDALLRPDDWPSPATKPFM